MVLQGEYEPSPFAWVRDQVRRYESSGGTEGGTLFDTGLRVIILTTRGARTGKLRKTPVIRIEYQGAYALVASMGGKPTNPLWYHNLVTDPSALTIQDGPEPFDAEARRVEGSERDDWWRRAVDVYPAYAEYQSRTTRLIPVFVARPSALTHGL